MKIYLYERMFKNYIYGACKDHPFLLGTLQLLLEKVRTV
jgi:hypothetical protein